MNQFIKYVGLGLVSSESSSEPKTRRGGITKTGNGHGRRLLVEAAWCYRFPARKTAPIQRRVEQTSVEAQAIAWEGAETPLWSISGVDQARTTATENLHGGRPGADRIYLGDSL